MRSSCLELRVLAPQPMAPQPNQYQFLLPPSPFPHHYHRRGITHWSASALRARRLKISDHLFLSCVSCLVCYLNVCRWYERCVFSDGFECRGDVISVPYGTINVCIPTSSELMLHSTFLELYIRQGSHGWKSMWKSHVNFPREMWISRGGCHLVCAKFTRCYVNFTCEFHKFMRISHVNLASLENFLTSSQVQFSHIYVWNAKFTYDFHMLFTHVTPVKRPSK